MRRAFPLTAVLFLFPVLASAQPAETRAERVDAAKTVAELLNSKPGQLCVIWKDKNGNPITICGKVAPEAVVKEIPKE